MRLRLLIAGTLLTALLGWRASAAPQDGAPPASAPTQPPPAVTPIVTATRQNAFTIPFRIEPTQNPSQQPVEVQLHLSTNQGTSWEIASRVKPDKGSFVFRAPHDGEYWYSIRTVDAQGVSRPEGPLQPQLKVIVDTVAPRLEVSVARGTAGHVVARWQAVDPNLKPGSFKLEYQSDSAGPWERVAVESPPSAMRHTLSGEATWVPSGGNAPLLVRAEITDQSGNPAVTQAVVKPGDPATITTASRAPAEGWRAPDPAGATSAPPGMPNPDQAAPATAGSNGTHWPPDRAMMEPLAGDGQRRETPIDTTRRPDIARTSSATGGAPRNVFQGTPAQSVSQNRPATRSGSPLDTSLLPPGIRPRMVNSRNFELEYEVDSVGPSGVSRIELWGTRDGGRTWSDFALDPDNRSPMPVKVDHEGIYGFRILVQSGNGLGGRRPAEGDLPDIWIGVDLSKPTCRITSAEVSPDGQELVVRWEAADDALDVRGVTLLFSTGAGQPWTPVASGLENSGSYVWRLDNRIPERILLKIEVRDEAGNIGSFESSEPLNLDRHRPEGRIRGVRSLAPGQ